MYEIAYVVLRKVEHFIRNTDTLILAAVSKYMCYFRTVRLFISPSAIYRNLNVI